MTISVLLFKQSLAFSFLFNITQRSHVNWKQVAVGVLILFPYNWSMVCAYAALLTSLHVFSCYDTKLKQMAFFFLVGSVSYVR